MTPDYTEAEAETIRSYVRDRRRERDAARAALLARARSDCTAVVSRIAREVGPARIYVWGSLVNTGHFSERSDIDIVVEGAPDPGRLYESAAGAQQSTDFELDVVRMESVHPAYAEHIRRRGRIVYEREGDR